jgi:hypothetical protein
MNLPQMQSDYVYLRDQFEEFGEPRNEEELRILVEVAVDLEILAEAIRQREAQLLQDS